MHGIALIQVLTTLPTEADALHLARLLVEARLAACVQVVGPITSIFRWEGQVQQAQEWACLVKTVADSYEAVAEAIRRHHPYQVPEILALPVSAVSDPYAQWVRAASRREPAA
ncbi:MAG: divalent-cation tolerance protein CutA [Chloroflexi bacterium]|nr:divalent-cation tolerance protein CutA [Chloroflexota bacterium]